jgi:uncharacterized protein
VSKLRIQIDSAALRDLCNRYRVQDLYVFGSATRDDFRPDSDVDVLIRPVEGHHVAFDEYLDIRDELSALVRRPVDLVLFSQIESPRANPIRRRNILATMERLDGC